MGTAQIKSELRNLSPDERRRLALSSWTAYVQREENDSASPMCNEDDPELLVALDHAVAGSSQGTNRGYSGDEVRGKLRQWTTK